MNQNNTKSPEHPEMYFLLNDSLCEKAYSGSLQICDDKIKMIIENIATFLLFCYFFI